MQGSLEEREEEEEKEDDDGGGATNRHKSDLSDLKKRLERIKNSAAC